jgi:hypothetical protein
MAKCSPRSNRPDFIIAGHPGTKLPCAKFALYLRKAGYNFVHRRTPRGVLLYHIGNEWFDKIKTEILLFQASQRMNIL